MNKYGNYFIYFQNVLVSNPFPLRNTNTSCCLITAHHHYEKQKPRPPPPLLARAGGGRGTRSLPPLRPLRPRSLNTPARKKHSLRNPPQPTDDMQKRSSPPFPSRQLRRCNLLLLFLGAALTKPPQHKEAKITCFPSLPSSFSCPHATPGQDPGLYCPSYNLSLFFPPQTKHQKPYSPLPAQPVCFLFCSVSSRLASPSPLLCDTATLASCVNRYPLLPFETGFDILGSIRRKKEYNQTSKNDSLFLAGATFFPLFSFCPSCLRLARTYRAALLARHE